MWLKPVVENVIIEQGNRVNIYNFRYIRLV